MRERELEEKKGKGYALVKIDITATIEQTKKKSQALGNEGKRDAIGDHSGPANHFAHDSFPPIHLWHNHPRKGSAPGNPQACIHIGY